MYARIENEFKIGSKERLNRIVFSIISVILAFITAILLVKLDAPFWWAFVVGPIEAFLLYVGSYIYMFVVLKKDKKEKKDEKGKLSLISIDKVIDHYQNIVHRRDLDLLFNITKKYYIDTKEKLQEAIKHYQNLLPRKVFSGGMAISICALAVSIAAFISVESQTSISKHLEVFISVLLIVVAIWFTCRSIGAQWFKNFGKQAMYERLEAALSELYFTATTGVDDDKKNAPERKENE